MVFLVRAMHLYSSYTYWTERYAKVVHILFFYNVEKFLYGFPLALEGWDEQVMWDLTSAHREYPLELHDFF